MKDLNSLGDFRKIICNAKPLLPYLQNGQVVSTLYSSCFVKFNEGQALGTVIKLLLEPPAFHNAVLGSSLGSTFYSPSN